MTYIISLCISLLFPVLLVMLLLQYLWQKSGHTASGRGITLLLAILAAGIVLIPVTGVSLARLLFSLNAHFSIPLTAVVLSAICRNASGKRLLDRNALFTTWIFGIIAGLALYPMTLGLTAFDPYILGWSFSWLFLIIAALTVFLLLKGNRFGILLLICMLAYQMHLFQSDNFWDYLVDPVLPVVSLIALFYRHRAEKKQLK